MPIYNFPNTESNDTFPNDDYLNLILRYREIALTSDAEPILTAEECTTLFHMYFNTLFLLARETGNLLKSTNLTQEKLHQVFSGYAEGTYNTLVKYLDKVRKSKYYTILFDYLKVDSTEENAPGTMIYQYSIITNSKALKKSASRRIDRTEPIQPEDLVQTIRGEYHIPDNVKYIPDFVLSLLEWYKSACEYDNAEQYRSNERVNKIFLFSTWNYKNANYKEQQKIKDDIHSGVSITQDGKTKTQTFISDTAIAVQKTVQQYGKYANGIIDRVQEYKPGDILLSSQVDKVFKLLLMKRDTAGSNVFQVKISDLVNSLSDKRNYAIKDEVKKSLLIMSSTFIIEQTGGLWHILSTSYPKGDDRIVKVAFDPLFLDYISQGAGGHGNTVFCKYPDAMFKLSNDKPGENAYQICVEIYSYHRTNYRKNLKSGNNPNTQNHLTKSLLEKAINIPSIDMLEDRAQYKQRIIRPYLTALNMLKDRGLITEYRFIDPDGNDIDVMNISYKEFVDSKTVITGEFPKYDNVLKYSALEASKQAPEGEIVKQ